MVMWGARLQEIVTENAVLKERVGRLEEAHDRLLVDYKRLVDLLGQAAFTKGTTAKFELDSDPYKEDDKAPDNWLSPGEDEIPDVRSVEERLTDAD
jgi:hypothetical protein